MTFLCSRKSLEFLYTRLLANRKPNSRASFPYGEENSPPKNLPLLN